MSYKWLHPSREEKAKPWDLGRIFSLGSNLLAVTLCGNRDSRAWFYILILYYMGRAEIQTGI